jgi:acyl-CoA thioesterase FadM
MNLWFRLLLICSGYIYDRRKLDPLGVSRLEFKVWPFDLDLNMHMNNGRYLSIMDLGRMDLIVRFGIMKQVLKNKWSPILASATIRYRKSLNPFQKFRLETRVVWWDEKWFYMEQRFVTIDEKDPDNDGIVAAIAFVKGSFYDRKNKKTVPSEELANLLGIDESEYPEKPEYISSWQVAEDDMRNLTKVSL